MASPAPPANPLIRKLVALLRSDAPEKQIAAAIVLGELEARDAAVIDGLLALADCDVGPLQRHALESLARLGSRLPARSTLPRVMPLLATRDDSVRAAAVGVVIGLGDAAIARVRDRLASAEGDERRALEEILARLGGKDAFSALLANLYTADAEGARAVTLDVRQQLKTTSARERKSVLGQVTKFVGSKTTQASPIALGGALRIMGYLEDPASVPRLVSYAVGKKVPDAVREEALIALRFALSPGSGAQARLADKLLAVAETAPIGVARTALYTLAGVTLPPAFVKRLARLADHTDGERALLAIERLAQMPGRQVAEALGRVLLATKDRSRAEAAGTALAARPDAAAALARGLCMAPDENRAWMLAKMLRSQVRTLDTKTVRALIEAGMVRLRGGTPGWEALLQTAREADAAAVANALRDEAERLRRGKKTERALAVLRALGRSAEATPQDGYVWAALELTAGRRDEAFVIFDQLLDRGFDVATALHKDRTLALDQRYHVGFHFAEKRHPLGEEVLTGVAGAGGRTKIARMARAKLKSAGFDS